MYATEKSNFWRRTTTDFLSSLVLNDRDSKAILVEEFAAPNKHLFNIECSNHVKRVKQGGIKYLATIGNRE